MKKKIEKKSDFILAKEIVATLELLEESFPDPADVGNFRKYMRDFTRNSGKEFVTKTVDTKLRVTRIK